MVTVELILTGEGMTVPDVDRNGDPIDHPFNKPIKVTQEEALALVAGEGNVIYVDTSDRGFASPPEGAHYEVTVPVEIWTDLASLLATIPTPIE